MKRLSPNPADSWNEPQPPVDPVEALRKNPLNAAKLKLMLTRTQFLELQPAILAGDYIPRKEVEQAFVQRVYAVRAAFEALPRQLANRLVGLSEREIEEVLD